MKTKEKILIVEDDDAIRTLLALTLANFNYEILEFDNGSKAKDYLEKTGDCDLAVLDLMLPGMSGYELIKWIRQKKELKNLPVMILSAKDKELDKIMGLDLGADDYMTKPFSVLELAARIRSLLRRTKTENEYLEAGPIRIDIENHKVYVDDQEIELTYKEFGLLSYLMQNPNRAIEREELITKIWGYDFIGESRTLDVHINSLRKKLGKPASSQIESVRQVGYRFKKEQPDA